MAFSKGNIPWNKLPLDIAARQKLDGQHKREKAYRQSPHGRAKRAAAQKARRRANTGKGREWRLKKYGLTHAEYDVMLTAQNGRCAICFRLAADAQWKVLRVDHDHTTNKIRGLLCHHCNVALGHFGDSKTTLLRAVTYLQVCR